MCLSLQQVTAELQTQLYLSLLNKMSILILGTPLMSVASEKFDFTLNFNLQFGLGLHSFHSLKFISDE